MRMFVSFLRDERGAAAVEFGLIAPIMLVVTLLIFDVWNAANSLTRMHAAVTTGAQYVMGGSANDTTARSIVWNAWNNRPANAAVTVQRLCVCGATTVACTGLCPTTQTPPSVTITLRASGTGEGVFMTRQLAQQEVVRVR
jgi:Flp pilus assembly protein TadG